MNEDLKTPYELFGIECGKGWKSLYQPILDRIEEINRETESNIVPTQIKEKFGRLVFYLNEENDELSKMIKNVFEKSSHICENCGKPTETIDDGGWLYTLCKDCYDGYKRRTQELMNKG